MEKPTGKLLFAYETIKKQEEVIRVLQVRVIELEKQLKEQNHVQNR